MSKEDQITRLKKENQRLFMALNQLVFKIDVEASNGTPLCPKGTEKAWIADYPRQLSSARELVNKLLAQDEQIICNAKELNSFLLSLSN